MENIAKVFPEYADKSCGGGIMQRDKYRENLVDKVVFCFGQMGASNKELKIERQRLMQDDPYLDSWLKSIDQLTNIPQTNTWTKVSRSLKLWWAA